jgi:pre-mRNA-splicing factor RBM22/SLT11
MSFERGLGSRSEVKKMGWEEADFPIVCERCLGANPYIRMIKTNYDRQCRVCERPFTVFRWRPGTKERFKKTEVCQVCARIKNACQACLLDLDTGASMNERDKTLDLDNKFEAPKDFVNRDYWAAIQVTELRRKVEAEQKARTDQEAEIKGAIEASKQLQLRPPS